MFLDVCFFCGVFWGVFEMFLGRSLGVFGVCFLTLFGCFSLVFGAFLGRFCVFVGWFWCVLGLFL